jgi:general secretion pathway protein H
MTQQRPHEAGFTVLELLVVLGILAVIISLVTVRLQGGAGAGLRLEAVARGIAQHLRQSRWSAVRSGTKTEVAIDFQGNTIRFPGAPADALPRGLVLRAAAGRPAAGMTISFYPDGSSSGGSFGLVRGAESASIAVDWPTGQAVVALAR